MNRVFSYGGSGARFCSPTPTAVTALARARRRAGRRYVIKQYICYSSFMVMRLRTFSLSAYQPLLRRAAILAGVSLVLALLLVGYLFGISDWFFFRLSGAFFVFFWLLAVTFLGVVPFVNWAAANWFGKTWAESPVTPAPRTPRKARPTTSRQNPRTAKRLE